MREAGDAQRLCHAPQHLSQHPCHEHLTHCTTSQRSLVQRGQQECRRRQRRKWNWTKSLWRVDINTCFKNNRECGLPKGQEKKRQVSLKICKCWSTFPIGQQDLRSLFIFNSNGVCVHKFLRFILSGDSEIISRALCDALALVDKKQKFLEETEETDEDEVSWWGWWRERDAQ